MAECCNNFKPDKDDFNRKNCDRDRSKHQERNNHLIKIITTADKKKPETTTLTPVNKLRIDLRHTIRGELVRQETEEDARAKRKEILYAAEKVMRQERHRIRQLEAEKFCKEYLQFTNFRIPVYESDEDRVDRLTFETVKYYAECADCKPKKTKTAPAKKTKYEKQQHKGYSYSCNPHKMLQKGLSMFTNEEVLESSSTEKFLKSVPEELDTD